jgi:hypothetical protein
MLPCSLLVIYLKWAKTKIAVNVQKRKFSERTDTTEAQRIVQYAGNI